MTPELATAIESLVGAAKNADVDLNTIVDDYRTPDWIRRLARRDAKALSSAVKMIEKLCLLEELK